MHVSRSNSTTLNLLEEHPPRRTLLADHHLFSSRSQPLFSLRYSSSLVLATGDQSRYGLGGTATESLPRRSQFGSQSNWRPFTIKEGFYIIHGVPALPKTQNKGQSFFRRWIQLRRATQLAVGAGRFPRTALTPGSVMGRSQHAMHAGVFTTPSRSADMIPVKTSGEEAH